MRCANQLRNAGLGRPTRQFNPTSPRPNPKRRKAAPRGPAGEAGAASLGAWINAVQSLKGLPGGGMEVADAVALIRATPPEKRSEYARQIWRIRRDRHGGTGRTDNVPF